MHVYMYVIIVGVQGCRAQCQVLAVRVQMHVSMYVIIVGGACIHARVHVRDHRGVAGMSRTVSGACSTVYMHVSMYVIIVGVQGCRAQCRSLSTFVCKGHVCECVHTYLCMYACMMICCEVCIFVFLFDI
jgi:hypothetical protein